MPLESTYVGDSLDIDLTIKDQGVVMDLADPAVSEVTTSARLGDRMFAPAVVTITDALNGRARASWTAGALREGVWTVEVRVVFTDGRVETFGSERLVVNRSAFDDG